MKRDPLLLAARLRDDIEDAWLDIRRRPMRSLLSGLGVGIGVAALVAMLSIGAGAERKSMQKFRSLGLQTIRIENASSEIRQTDRSMLNLSQGLSEHDLRALQRAFAREAGVAGLARENHVKSVSSGLETQAILLGVTPGWTRAERLELAWGRFIWPADEKAGRRVCLVGASIARALRLRPRSAMRADGTPCVVIGALKPKGRLLTEGTGLSSLDFDRAIAVPLSAFPRRHTFGNARALDGIVIRMRGRDERRLLAIAEKAEGLLKRNHHGVRDYRLVVPLKLLRQAKETQRTFALVMDSIAALSLLVGGIGIMNVMLANIAEQTREIGLRMAVGAPPGRIVSLYLTHAAAISIGGGAWGVLAGMLLALLVQFYAGWSVAFSPLSLLLAPGFALATGLIFGAYPALRASSLQPARALRES